MPRYAGRACCPKNCYLIEILNSNQATDDNFAVVLNGHSIGTLNLSADGVCNGGWWTNCGLVGDISESSEGPEDATKLCNIPIKCCTGFGGPGNCGVTPDCSTTLTAYNRIPSSWFVTGLNTLDMNNIHDNGNANFGNVYVWRIQQCNTGDWKLVSTLLETVYSGGFGASFSFTFTI